MGNVSFGNGWEGRVVEGRFPLLEWLGGSESRGSFFTVLQGLQEAVIELIVAGGAEADAYIAQWDFAMALSDPHLVRVLAAGRCVIDGIELVYVVTERSYSTLAKIIQTRALKADSARETFLPVLNALSYLHKNGVVHGHINPLNIQFADLKPKLSVTDFLISGTIKRTIQTPGLYDAPELADGVVTAAADTWSVGMTLWEAMTQAPPAWDRSGNKEPEVAESLPGSFREIVQDCLRVDPLRRCTISSIVERMDRSKSISLPEEPIPVKVDSSPPALDNTVRAEPPVTTSEIPVAVKPEARPFPGKEIETAEPSEPVLFSKSLTHFEERPLARFRVVPFAVLILALIALISVLLIRRHMTEIPPSVASQPAPTASQPVPAASQPAPAASQPVPEQPATTAPAPPVAGQTEPETSTPVSPPQPSAAPQTEAQSAPTAEQPASAPPAALNREVPRGRTEGLVVKRVIPTVSPGARSGMRRPVQVLIRVSVNEDGAVSDASYMSLGPGNYFARLAQRAAESWKFKPPTRNGNPERSVWMLRFNFERAKTEVIATEETK